MNMWLTLITSLPTGNATDRMRAWRALKASGAAVLRDGVYLLPDNARCSDTFTGIAADVLAAEGSAMVLRVEEPAAERFADLFDRTAEYTALLPEVVKAQASLSPQTIPDAVRQVRKLRKQFAALSEIDFFPGPAQMQIESVLQDLEAAIARAQAPDEPQPVEGDVTRRQISDFQGRVWATRKRPWVDRMASAWLIRRFIDPNASFVWLDSPDQCPSDALGFDFDGATFSHVGNRVTFEVLAASFNLESPSMKRLGYLVHFLDVGGMPTPEALGVVSVLSGIRSSVEDDAQLMEVACGVFDGLLSSFEKGIVL